MRLSGALAFSLATTCLAFGFQRGDARTEVRMSSVKTALSQFEADFGHYPTTSEGLAVLVHRPAGIAAAPAGKWHGPYVESVQDAWGQDFVYLCPGVHNTNGFDLYSRGVDGLSKRGGNDADDINNWDSSRTWRQHYTHAAHMRRTMPFVYGIVMVACLAGLAWWTHRITSRGGLSR